MFRILFSKKRIFANKCLLITQKDPIYPRLHFRSVSTHFLYIARVDCDEQEIVERLDEIVKPEHVKYGSGIHWLHSSSISGVRQPNTWPRPEPFFLRPSVGHQFCLHDSQAFIRLSVCHAPRMCNGSNVNPIGADYVCFTSAACIRQTLYIAHYSWATILAGYTVASGSSWRKRVEDESTTRSDEGLGTAASM
jgi:hypothetical protein